MKTLNFKTLDNVMLPKCFVKQENRFNVAHALVRTFSFLNEEECKLATIVIIYDKFNKEDKQIKFEYIGNIGFYLLNAFYIHILKIDKVLTNKIYGKEVNINETKKI